jgi:hypothetical protein
MGVMSTSDFDETKHARDRAGRFSEFGGSAPDGPSLRLTDTETAAAEVSDFVGRIIGARSRQYRLDTDGVDDARQNVMLELVATQNKRGRPLTVEDDGRLIRHITRAVLSKGTDPNVSDLDRKAYTMWRDEVARLEAADEKFDRAQVADAIRESFPPGQRPHYGFHDIKTPVSLDAPVGADGDTFGSFLPSPEDGYTFSDDDSDAARLAAAYENEEIDHTTARRGAWDAVAAPSGAPRVAEASVSRKDASAHRASVTAAGGVLTQVRAWQDGTLDERAGRAVFAPFGDLGNQDMQRICNVLEAYPDYADGLWEAAMTVAVARNRSRLI